MNELLEKQLNKAGWIITDETDEDGNIICRPVEEDLKGGTK